jgi:hypothetical protein
MAAKVVGEPIEGWTINPEKAVFMIEKAKEINVKDVVTDPDSGSNAADDKMISGLEDHKDDPARAELAALVGSLNVDEQIDLVALMWMGRDDYEADERRRTIRIRAGIWPARRFWATFSKRVSTSSVTRSPKSNLSRSDVPTAKQGRLAASRSATGNLPGYRQH